VVWVAQNPNSGGTFVVGWYANATVFRKWQEPPQGSERTYHNEPLGYYAKAEEKSCVLLPVIERMCHVPTGKGGMGQANI